MSTPPRWSDLPVEARLWRIGHGFWAFAQLTALAYTWRCAVARRRTRRLWAGIAFLGIEGAALVAGRGNCPVGPRQEAWGDPVPFFELLLPPRAAKAAIPVLAIVSAAAIAAVVVRTPRQVASGPGLNAQRSFQRFRPSDGPQWNAGRSGWRLRRRMERHESELAGESPRWVPQPPE